MSVRLRRSKHETNNGDDNSISATCNISEVKLAKGLKFVHMNIRSLLHNLDETNACFLDGAFDAFN